LDRPTQRGDEAALFDSEKKKVPKLGPNKEKKHHSHLERGEEVIPDQG